MSGETEGPLHPAEVLDTVKRRRDALAHHILGLDGDITRMEQQLRRAKFELIRDKSSLEEFNRWIEANE